MQIQDQPVSEVITHFRYILYGFGGACGVIVFLLGVVFKLVGAKIKQAEDDRKQAETDRQRISELSGQIDLVKQDVEGLKDHELARSSFSRGLYNVSEKLTGVKSDMDHMKEDLRDMKYKCDRWCIPPSSREDEK